MVVPATLKSGQAVTILSEKVALDYVAQAKNKGRRRILVVEKTKNKSVSIFFP